MHGVSQRVFLKFREPVLEAAYDAEGGRLTRRWYRIWSIVDLCIYVALLLLDPQTAGDPENLHVITLVRLGVMIPAAVATAAFGWVSAERFARHREAAVAFGFVTGLGSFTSMSALVPHPERISLQVPLMALCASIVVMCLWSAILRLRFLALTAIVGADTFAELLLWNRYSAGIGTDALVWYAVTIFTGLMFAYLLEQSSRATFVSQQLLEEERRRSERLLHNVLPMEIAERLKHDPGRIAERFEDVTVLFGDLVGFTQLSTTMEPETLVATLDEIFSGFDQIAMRHGLEKIKTIGDAYMVVGGVPNPRADHAQAVVQMALEMMEVVGRQRLPGGQSLGMRIGIHSGPVVAGVIGKHKFIYDLWGDTVNVASRMESHGVVGKVQISAETRGKLDARFALTARGAVDIKGKGELHTWFVEPHADPHEP